MAAQLMVVPTAYVTPELRQRWVDPAQLPALAELSLAEHRAAARRLRLDRLHG